MSSTTTRSPKRRIRLIATIVGLAALAAPVGLTGCGAGSSSTPAGSSAGSLPTEPVGVTDTVDTVVTHVARPTHDGVQVRTDPDATSAVVSTLGLATPLGSPTTLLVLDRTEAGGVEWVQVALASRPNGSQGWVPADDVTEQETDFEVTVSLSEHLLRVTRGGQVAVETPVAVGADATPTPVGRFYVTDVVDTGKPGGAYGPFALGLSAHSDVLDQFAGGDGQIGIHGTDEPSSIGASVSHGCVRVPNEVITTLAANLPLGTPVTITA